MRIALAQINPVVGDVRGNAARIAAVTAQAREAGADLVVFPELAISGYPPKDLLLREGFVTECTRAAKQLGETHSEGLTLIFGCPLPADGVDGFSGAPPSEPASPSSAAPAPVANALLVYRANRFIDSYDKRLLPTYDVFDEDRYFTPGDRAVVVGVPCRACAGSARVGLAICEDLWKGEDVGFASHYANSPDPVAEAVRLGAQVLVVPSASPFVLGKGQRHRRLLRMHASMHKIFVAAVNQVGGNDDLVFDGHAAVIAPDGSLLDAAPGFIEHLLVTDIPFDDVGPTLPNPLRPLADPLLTASEEQLLFHALTLGTRDYLYKTGFRTALVALSGGIDSAVTATLAVAALGAENVIGVSLPSRFSSTHSREDAAALASNLGIRLWSMSIADTHAAIASTLDPLFDTAGLARLGRDLPDPTDENVQSRIRGLLMMALSNRTGALVLTTGNKSELAVGYCTLYGDMNGGLAVLSDVAKMQVYALARWINANHALYGFPRSPIPERSITKPPSAELRPDQTDQDSLPPYEVLDAIIEQAIETHASPRRIAEETGLDPATVARIVRMIDRAEFKRRQLATGLKVTSVAFGPGRRFPIAQGWNDSGV